jgi:hypothetical protein
LTYVCAFADNMLVGFVNVAWDGGVHGFLLDPTVHPRCNVKVSDGSSCNMPLLLLKAMDCIGSTLITKPHLDSFYRGCGFQPTLAGLIQLNQ